MHWFISITCSLPQSAEPLEQKFVETERQIKSSRPLTAPFHELCLFKNPGEKNTATWKINEQLFLTLKAENNDMKPKSNAALSVVFPNASLNSPSCSSQRLVKQMSLIMHFASERSRSGKKSTPIPKALNENAAAYSRSSALKGISLSSLLPRFLFSPLIKRALLQH